MILTVSSVKAQFAPEYRLADSLYLNVHSPQKATFYSAILPGLGQIYNDKYWKVPLIYAGFGGMIYYLNYNNYVYNIYKDAYDIKVRIGLGETALEDPMPGYSEENIKSSRDQWRRWRDLTIISIGLLYVAQIIDANVDAYFYDYDMSPDLSLRVEPTILNNVTFSSNNRTSIGLRCSIRF